MLIFSVFWFLIFFCPKYNDLTQVHFLVISWNDQNISPISQKTAWISKLKQTISWCFMALRGIWKALEELIDKSLLKIYIEIPNVLNTQKCTHNIPPLKALMIFPQCTHDILPWGFPNRGRYGYAVSAN